MKIADQLDRLRRESPGVSLVAFADLSSGLILNSSAEAPCRRELLDLLGERAVAGFALLPALAAALNTDSGQFGSAVIGFSQTETQVFVRDPAAPADALCLVAGPGTPAEPLVQRAARLAHGLGGAP